MEEAPGLGAPAQEPPCEPEIALRPPQVNDFSVAASGSAVAFGTRQHGVLLADLVWPAEGRPLESQWSCVAGPDLSSNASRVAFNPCAGDKRQLVMASGRTVAVVDVGASDSSRPSHSSFGGGRPLWKSGSFGGSAVAGGGTVGMVSCCLSAHLCPVTALDWSPHHRAHLATCAEDSRFFIWDVRMQSVAQALLCTATWTAAVRWSPHSEFLLATGHEDTVCTWDIRNASHNMSVLSSGQSRILSVDWSPHDRDKLLSVSAHQGAQAASSGSIKVWDVTSQHKVHESIDIENGFPAAAKFLPFGPAILAAVESDVVLFQLPRDGGRRATVVRSFQGHGAPVSAVSFAQSPEGQEEWRFLALSQAERCCRGWRYSLPEYMVPSLVRLGGLPPAEPMPSPGTTTSTPECSPVLGPSASPRATLEDKEKEAKYLEAKYLGCLARHQAFLQKLSCVEEITSAWHELREGGSGQYQLRIDVKTANGIRLTVTVGMEPNGTVKHKVDWADEWAGTFDGPLAPGAVEQIFGSLTSAGLQRDHHELCRCVQALERTLLRRDLPPQLGRPCDEPPAPPSGPARRPGGKGALPFPRTCGVCWSPQGSLLSFRSLRNVQVPFPRRWSFDDLKRILSVVRDKDSTLLYDDADEHAAAAAQLRLDCSIHFVPTAALCSLVEDHWWTTAMTGTLCSSPTSRGRLGPAALEAPVFLLEPSPLAPTAPDICRHNRDTAIALGRGDLAEVWRLLASLADDELNAAKGLRAGPFAQRLVRGLIHQLFNAQETLTLAMLAVVLCMGPTAVEPVEAAPKQAMSRQVSSEEQRGKPPGKRVSPTRMPDPSPLVSFSRLSSYATWSGPVQKPRGFPSYDCNSTDTTHSACSGVQDRRLVEDSLRPAKSPPEYLVRREAPSAELPDLIPSDAPTLELLLHSVHAHCDLLHRLGRFSASRALAKILRKFKSDDHDLPILYDESRFGSLRRPSAAVEAGGKESAGEAPLPQPGGRGTSGSGAGRPLPQCKVCGLRMRRLHVPCTSCGHGYHLQCLRQWFASARACPALGCECRCLELCPLDWRAGRARG